MPLPPQNFLGIFRSKVIYFDRKFVNCRVRMRLLARRNGWKEVGRSVAKEGTYFQLVLQKLEELITKSKFS